MDQIDLTGYTAEEIEHMQRVEQKQALHQEIYWLADQLKGEAKEIARTVIQRIAYLNHQGDEFETRAINSDAIANGAIAAAQELERQRDLIADEYAEFIKSVQDGTNPIVREMMARVHQEAFEEFQGVATQIKLVAQKLRKAESA